ncbi:hypothetical protein C7293_16235 [filamentous cyanobacterium CCT1]|nr:hypothetical protein C7293_16235 [filamentous cyanobacterium CCT1]PSN76451.1 hypothetical protein C8B47_27225 [filamentous cyanobacterium CCP4]
MATLTFKRLGRIVAIALLCLSLWSCGLVNPRPPRAVVEMAIAQKLSQTQAVLYRQLESSVDPADLAQVGRIRISDHHWTTLANQPAVEVAGTYHLKGGQLTAAQRRQTRDFDLYLRRGDSKDQWLLLEPVLGRSGEVLRWQSTPLVKPEAASSV